MRDADRRFVRITRGGACWLLHMRVRVVRSRRAAHDGRPNRRTIDVPIRVGPRHVRARLRAGVGRFTACDCQRRSSERERSEYGACKCFHVPKPPRQIVNQRRALGAPRVRGRDARLGLPCGEACSAVVGPAECRPLIHDCLALLCIELVLDSGDSHPPRLLVRHSRLRNIQRSMRSKRGLDMDEVVRQA